MEGRGEADIGSVICLSPVRPPPPPNGGEGSPSGSPASRRAEADQSEIGVTDAFSTFVRDAGAAADLGRSPREDAGKMDTFTCGNCGKNFHKLMDILEHKLQHVEPGLKLCCQFCGMSFSRQISLREHYHRQHKIIFTKTKRILTNSLLSLDKMVDQRRRNHNSSHMFSVDRATSCSGGGSEEATSFDTLGSLVGLGPSEIVPHSNGDTDGQADMTYAIKENALNLNSNGERFIEDAENHMSDTICLSNQTEVMNSEAEKQGEMCKDDQLDDFNFILVTNTIQGNSFSYGRQSFKCLHCEFKTHWKSSICKHMKDKHSDVMAIHQCIEIKPNSFNDNQRLMKMSEYTQSVYERYKGKQSASKKMRGVEKQDRPGTYQCSKCSKVFGRLRYLRKHLQIHRTESKFFCEECGKAFKTRTYLVAHQRTHKKEAYKCSQCDFTSTIHAAIHAHRQLHNQGSVLCDICGFAYTDRSTLNKHKRVHDPSRPYACTFPGCTWRFKTDIMCKAHYRAHTTEGKFKCSICGYIFRHKHHLQRHEMKMHGIQQTRSRSQKSSTLTDSDITDTVNLIVNSEATCDQLQAALQNSHLVITTDCQGDTINYEVSDIAMMNVTYQTLLQGQDNPNGDTKAILIPQTNCEQVIFQQEAETS